MQGAARGRRWRLPLLAATGLVCAWAQQSTTTSGPTSSTTGSPSTTAPPVSSSAQGAGNQRAVFLSGIVLTDDGSPMPRDVSILSICGTVRRTMGHASARGSFGFQWSTTTGAYGDASQALRTSGGSGVGSVTGSRNGSRGLDPLAICELLAESSGYSSSRVSLYNRGGQDSYDVGAILLHLIVAGEGHTVSVLALKAPKDAKKSFEKGTSQAAENKLPEAVASFEKAVAIYPEYADAWLSLGGVQWQTARKEDARASFRKAMELDAKLVGPWQELGYLACSDSRWEEAAKYLDQATRLDPVDSPSAWYFDALASYNLGRFEQAERSVRAEIKLDRGRNPREEFLLGLILIARNDLEGGATALRNYIATAPESQDLNVARRQLSKVESQIAQ